MQRILRHANVSTTANCYIKTAADDVKHAMAKIENNIPQDPEIVRDTVRYQGRPSARLVRPRVGRQGLKG